MLGRLQLLQRVAATPTAGPSLRVLRPAMPTPSSSCLRHAQRRCATQTEAKASAQANANTTSAAAGEAKAATAPPSHGPQRKDWRTHKDIVYVKGVPAKGSFFKLPLSEQLIICLVFSIAGSAAVYLVRPQIRYLCHHGFLGLTDEASWKSGPWLYRLIYCCIMLPSYSLILFIIGGLFGRRIWFSFMIHKMWSRFLTKNASQRLQHILDIQHY